MPPRGRGRGFKKLEVADLCLSLTPSYLLDRKTIELEAEFGCYRSCGKIQKPAELIVCGRQGLSNDRS
jgi:hypothetical protein